MGLIITSRKEKKQELTPIIIKGTSISVPSLYARVDYAARQDGKTLECSFTTYFSKVEYKKGTPPLATNLLNDSVGGFKVTLQEGQEQDINTAYELCINGIKKLGFEAKIEN